MEWYIAVGFCSFVAGAVISGLIIRNNYKHFVQAEKEVHQHVLDATLSAEQKLLRIRRLFKI